jgi:hypothetical protein
MSLVLRFRVAKLGIWNLEFQIFGISNKKIYFTVSNLIQLSLNILYYKIMALIFVGGQI